MPVTRSELMYLAVGIAVGSVVGRNWDKVKSLLEPMLGPAAAGFSNAYGDVMSKYADQAEFFKDSQAAPKPVPQPAAAKTTRKKSRPSTRRQRTRRSKPLRVKSI